MSFLAGLFTDHTFLASWSYPLLPSTWPGEDRQGQGMAHPTVTVLGVAEERVRPWRWPGQWFRDEKFWRDVASRTASGLIVALLIYLFAIFAGYVGTPSGLGVLFAIGAFVMVAVFTRVQMKRFNRMYGGPNPTWREEQPKFNRGLWLFILTFVVYTAGFAVARYFVSNK